MDSGADDRLDRPAQEDEQRLREVPMCERGGVGVRCHDSPHGEAARPCLRTFHTASEVEFCEVRKRGILRSPYPASCIARSSGPSKARLVPSNTRPKHYNMLWCRMDMHPSAWGFGLLCP